jgi:hypothetical protein
LARLFVTVESDRANKHQIANQYLEIKIFYGSREKSHLAKIVLVKARDPQEPEINLLNPFFYSHLN